MIQFENIISLNAGSADVPVRTALEATSLHPLKKTVDRFGAVRDVIAGVMYEDEFEEKVKPLLSRNHGPKVRG